MSNIEVSILKELDLQNVKGNNIAIIMNKLENDEIKKNFLSFILSNNNTLLSFSEIMKFFK